MSSTKATAQIKERDVVKEIIRDFTLAEHLVFPQNSDVRHGGYNALYKNGTPDLIILLKSGYTIYIEVKATSKNKMRDSQIYISDQIRKRAGLFYCVNGENWRDVLSCYL